MRELPMFAVVLVAGQSLLFAQTEQDSQSGKQDQVFDALEEGDGPSSGNAEQAEPEDGEEPSESKPAETGQEALPPSEPPLPGVDPEPMVGPKPQPAVPLPAPVQQEGAVAPLEPPPAEELLPAVEAAPVELVEPAPTEGIAAEPPAIEQLQVFPGQANGEQQTQQESPFGLRLRTEHAFGTGTFLANDALRQRYDKSTISWEIRPSYRFPLFGHTLEASLRLQFEVDLTTPDNSTGRRFRPSDASVYLTDPEIYEEPYSGIAFRGGMRVFLPTSYESLYVKKQWTAWQGFAGMKRSIGPLAFAYTFAFVKYFNQNTTPTRTTSNSGTRASDPGRAVGGDGDPAQISIGFANRNVGVFNAIRADLNITDQLKVSYSLMFLNYWKYTLNAKRDQYTAPNADSGAGRQDYLWPTLEVSYGLNQALGALLPSLPWPFELTASLGISALHPAQTKDNGSVLWPLFYQVFAENRAATNFGSIYIGLLAAY